MKIENNFEKCNSPKLLRFYNINVSINLIWKVSIEDKSKYIFRRRMTFDIYYLLIFPIPFFLSFPFFQSFRIILYFLIIINSI